MVFVAVVSNTLLQSRVRDDMRGRVMAALSMTFLGIAPLGSLAVGSLAHGIGIRPMLFLCGAPTITAGLVHARRLRQRRDGSPP